MKKSATYTGIAAAGLALALLAAPALAGENSNDGNGPSVQGAVSDVAGTTIKLLSGLVTVDASGAAIVAENDNVPLALTDLKVGSVVQVEGTMAGQVLHATVIQVHGPKHDGTIQGPIGAVDAAGGHFSVLGLSIAVTTTTVFAGNNGVATSAADLTVGKAVAVEVTVFQGSLIATRISFDGGDAQSEHNN